MVKGGEGGVRVVDFVRGMFQSLHKIPENSANDRVNADMSPRKL